MRKIRQSRPSPDSRLPISDSRTYSLVGAIDRAVKHNVPLVALASATLTLCSLAGCSEPLRTAAAVNAAATSAAASPANWLRFRGPQGSGVATAPGLPVEWTLKDYAWKTKLVGTGHSSPVVQGERLFVTAADDDGKIRQLFCLDTRGGNILWKRALSSLSEDDIHDQGSFASSTPAVSNNTVVATFADDNHYLAAAYQLDGTPLWTTDIGPFNGEHGFGASPIIWNGIVILPNDQDGESSYVALDEASGDVLWEVPRESKVAAYGTPLILESHGGQAQLITSSNAMGVTSLDPTSGRTLWSTGSLPQRTVSSPILGEKLVFQACGVGGSGRLLVGVDPSLKDHHQPRVVFKVDKRIPYVPTPLFCDGYLYLWGDSGVVMCLDPTSTEPVWMERVGGDFSSSPVCVNHCLYNVSENGEVVVLRAGPKYEVLGRSPLGEPSQATPAVAGGRMYFHTQNHVLCLAPNEPVKTTHQ